MLILALYPNLLNVSIHKKTQKNEVKFSEFGITKFNLVVFTISQWDLVLQLSFSNKSI